MKEYSKSNKMSTNPNLALGKSIVEEICWVENTLDGKPYNRCSSCPERKTCNKVHNPLTSGVQRLNLTNGDVRNYNEYNGYVSVIAPATITLDLGEVTPVTTIQFLLWDNCGGQKSENCNRKYQYRLLVSADGTEWNVLFDSFRDGYCGWQRFDLSSALEMRYIRFHALTINDKTPPPFMIVEMEAYARMLESYDYRFMPTLHTDININPSAAVPLQILGRKSHHKLSQFFSSIVGNLQKEALEHKSRGHRRLTSQIEHLIQAMSSIQSDIILYENGVDDIKGKILNQTESELKKGQLLERVGIISFVLGIIGIIYSLYDIYSSLGN